MIDAEIVNLPGFLVRFWGGVDDRCEGLEVTGVVYEDVKSFEGAGQDLGGCGDGGRGLDIKGERENLRWRVPRRLGSREDGAGERDEGGEFAGGYGNVGGASSCITDGRGVAQAAIAPSYQDAAVGEFRFGGVDSGVGVSMSGPGIIETCCVS